MCLEKFHHWELHQPFVDHFGTPAKKKTELRFWMFPWATSTWKYMGEVGLEYEHLGMFKISRARDYIYVLYLCIYMAHTFGIGI